MVMTQQLKEEWAARLRAPANLPFEAPAGYMDALEQVDTRTLKILTSVGENTSYLITPKGGVTNDVLVINIHGGGFVQPHNPWDGALCAHYAVELGSTVLDIDYRTCPEVMYPTPMIECYETVQWAMDHAAELGIDPEKVVLGGNSAGATLTATTCLRAQEQGGRMPALALLIYPACDPFVTPEAEDLLNSGMDLTRLENRGMLYNAMFTNNDPALEHEVYLNLNSATEEQLQRFPETVVITAGKDYLRYGGEKFASKLAVSGNRVTLQRFCGSAHGFYARCTAEWQQARALVYETIRRKFSL